MTGPDVPTTAIPLRRRSGRIRRVALALTIVVTTALVLWGIDWAARLSAQSLLARELQSATGTPARPSVAINGPLFLVQVLRGRYDDVQVDIADLTSGPLRIAGVHAELAGVYVSFHDVLVRQVDQVYVESSTEDVFLTYEDLNSYLLATGHQLTLHPTPEGTLQVTGSVEVFGKSITASADARISVDGGALSVVPVGLQTGTVLDKAGQLLLGQRFTLLIPLSLPLGQQLTDIEVQPDGLAVRAGGSQIVVTPPPP